MKTDKQQKGADNVKINIELIEQLRKQRGYSMEQMAAKLNYNSRATYCNKVNEHRGFTLNDLLIVSMIFDIELSELIKK